MIRRVKKCNPCLDTNYSDFLQESQDDIWNIREKDIAPQPGPQKRFASCGSRVAIFGGEAGGGKTWAVTYGAARFTHLQNYNFMIFRREQKQVDCRGGLWDQSAGIFPYAKGIPRHNDFLWRFPSGASGKLASMEHKKDFMKYDGAQVGYIGFDELQHFTSEQFWYLLSRNRSPVSHPGGQIIPPLVRCSCNPLPNSWLARLLQWYWDADTGYPIPERSGKIRWCVRDGDDVLWGDPDWRSLPKSLRKNAISFTFIRSRLADNPRMTQENPQYESGLAMLPRVEQERLRYGNWKITASAGDYFPRSMVSIVDAAPAGIKVARAWDQAATKPSPKSPDPDWTAGVRISTDGSRYYVEHVERLREDPNAVNMAIQNTAQQDGKRVRIGLFQDPGSAGKALFSSQSFMLSGFVPVKIATTRDKVTQALPFSAQWCAGNVSLVRGPWNEAYLNEMNDFGSGSGHDDQVDASSGAFNLLRAPVLTGIGASF